MRSARCAEARVFIDDTASIGVLEMRAKARRLQAEHGLHLLIIDYIQLMQGRGRFENRQQELASISRSLKGLAKELHVPIVALSQLSRAPETRSDHRPQLSDLRESGALEQDADVVMFIFREDQYRDAEGQPNQEAEGVAEIIIGKQRNGPTGVAKLAFIKEHTRFENLAQQGREVIRPTVARVDLGGASRPTCSRDRGTYRHPSSIAVPRRCSAAPPASSRSSRRTPTATVPRRSALALERRRRSDARVRGHRRRRSCCAQRRRARADSRLRRARASATSTACSTHA